MHEVVIVGEQVAGEAAKARKDLVSLISNQNKTAFDIGSLLHTIKSRGWYDGFNTFKEYLQTLDIKERKAHYLRRVAEVMDACGIARQQYEPVGISKLRLITSLGGNPYDPSATWTNPETGFEIPLKEFIVGFVEKHQSLSYEEIKRDVKTLKGLIGENDLVTEQYTYTQAVKDNIIDPAVELARRNLGSVGRDEEGDAKDASTGRCIEVWATEYLNDPANNILEEQ